MSLVHLGNKLLWQLLNAVHHHLVTIGSGARHGHLAKCIPSLISLPRQSGNNSNSGIVLVQSCGKLFPGARQLLLEVICL